MSPRVPVFLVILVLLVPSRAEAQDGPPPTIRGTAVLTRGPRQVDTIPVLCHDAADPSTGFITDIGDTEWAPEVDLSLWLTPGSPGSVSVRIDDGEATYDRSFPVGPPMQGGFAASVNIVSWDPGPGVDYYFAVDCSKRLERGG